MNRSPANENRSLVYRWQRKRAGSSTACGEHVITHPPVEPANILVVFGADGGLITMKLAHFVIAKAAQL